MPLPSMAFVADFGGSWPTSLTRSFPSHLGLSRDTDFFLAASASLPGSFNELCTFIAVFP